jgi:hypothetical protein
MAYQLKKLACDELKLSDDGLRDRIEQLFGDARRRYQRLWAYYRNPVRVCAVDSDEQGAERPYRQAQEWGLPSRITGARSGCDMLTAQLVDGVARKEVVIENDIAWRIDTMVDFLFGKPIVINSAAPDKNRRAIISQLLRLILARNGGITFLQQLSLLGSVYGFVDVLVKFNNEPASAPELNSSCATQSLGEPPSGCEQQTTESNPVESSEPDADDGEASASVDDGSAPRLDASSTETGANDNHSPEVLLQHIARMIRLEIVEPARALPVLSPDDYRHVLAYAQCYQTRKFEKETTHARRRGWIERFIPRRSSLVSQFNGDRTLVVDLIGASSWQRYEDETLIRQGINSLGDIPLVHVQNTALPFEYSGASDVEPLMPLQDELNTRLSDRASRITLQSFKMYLGKGIEGFNKLPVAPGRMWMTDNDQADVIEFGGDASNPSEEAHITDLREALDKTSGVTPIAAGAIKGRIGHLTSAAALRITMQALLAKTEKKRTTYGGAISRMCELAMAWLDVAGVFRTTPEERRIEINWPSPLPENDQERLQEAESKARLGVPRDVILRELGY